ncbi:response regulator [Arthrobacter frigidicola]|nr:response regulator [Arthrobacter frigidicola]
MAQMVLVVDDDERFRDLTTRLLESCGYALGGEAGSVAGALHSVDASRPDVALVDIGLPDGDGLELSRQLTGAPYRVRVVLISSDSDATSADEAAAAGAEGFLPKSELSCSALRSILGDG